MQEAQELIDDGDRQWRCQEAPHDLFVVGAVNREVQQVVFAQEVVEQVRGQHQRRRHGNANAGEPVRHAALVQQVSYEGQAARFTAQRTAADLKEEIICRLKCRRIEFADERLALLAAILRNGLDQVAPQVFMCTEVGNFARPELLRQGEFGPRHQPVREVIVFAVIGNAFYRDRMQQHLQRVQIAGACNFGFAIGQTKNKVAEPNLLDQNAAQISQQSGRPLLQERKLFRVSALHEFRSAGLKHDGDIPYRAADHAGQLEAGLRSQLSPSRKLHIRHHPEKVVAVLHHLLLGILVVGAQQDLWPGPHSHQLVRDIQSFAEQPPGLADDLGVNDGQEQRVVTNVIFHHQHHGYAHGFGVVLDVALVLDVLDDRDQDAGVTLPQKYPLDAGLRIARNEVLNLAIIVGQSDDRNVEIGGLDFARQLRGIHVPDLQVGHDQVEARLGARQFQRFGPAGDMRDAGDLMNVQLQRLAHQQFVQASVLAQNEGVVQAGNQQNVVHAERHQVLEALELELGRRGGVGGDGSCHGRCFRPQLSGLFRNHFFLWGAPDRVVERGEEYCVPAVEYDQVFWLCQAPCERSPCKIRNCPFESRLSPITKGAYKIHIARFISRISCQPQEQLDRKSTRL